MKSQEQAFQIEIDSMTLVPPTSQTEGPTNEDYLTKPYESKPLQHDEPFHTTTINTHTGLTDLKLVDGGKLRAAKAIKPPRDQILAMSETATNLSSELAGSQIKRQMRRFKHSGQGLRNNRSGGTSKEKRKHIPLRSTKLPVTNRKHGRRGPSRSLSCYSSGRKYQSSLETGSSIGSAFKGRNNNMRLAHDLFHSAMAGARIDRHRNRKRDSNVMNNSMSQSTKHSLRDRSSSSQKRTVKSLASFHKKLVGTSPYARPIVKQPTKQKPQPSQTKNLLRNLDVLMKLVDKHSKECPKFARELQNLKV